MVILHVSELLDTSSDKHNPDMQQRSFEVVNVVCACSVTKAVAKSCYTVLCTRLSGKDNVMTSGN